MLNRISRRELFFSFIVAWILFFSHALIVSDADAFGKKPAPSPSPTPSVVASATPSPSPSPSIPPVLSPGTFVTMGEDLGSSVDRAYAAQALALMNRAYVNGCLRSSIEHHNGFKSFNTVFDVSPKTAKVAADEYLGGAPYALDLRWYYKWTSKVIGYTYNFRDDDWNGKSETRIWSNTKYIGNDPKPYAAHLAHELSHQARAGGFVHYTIFGGSFPYEVGDLMEACLRML